MAYIGCVLFGLIFLVLSTQATGSFQARMSQTMAWIHGWAPYSYIIIALLLAAPAVMLQIMNSWPKRVVPEDPMAKYRREAEQGMNEPMED